MPVSANRLIADNLGVRFGSSWVFRGLSLKISASDRTALVGRSGAGKSILLRCLAMLQPLDEGTLTFNGQVVAGSAVPRFRSRVMYVPQRTSDIDGTVEDFLKLPFCFAVHSAKEYDGGVTERLLSSLELPKSFLQKPQRELSGGERQIAALMRAILLEPAVLLLDEPTAAMDRQTSANCERLVQTWLDEDQRRSTIWVTHDHDQAKRVASSVVEIDSLVSQGVAE